MSMNGEWTISWNGSSTTSNNTVKWQLNSLVFWPLHLKILNRVVATTDIASLRINSKTSDNDNTITQTTKWLHAVLNYYYCQMYYEGK